MILHLHNEVHASVDVETLLSLIRPLLGQQCLKVELSYGGELMLHLGDAVPYDNIFLKDEMKGSWILGTRASNWKLLLNERATIVDDGWLELGRRQDVDGVQIEAESRLGSVLKIPFYLY